MLHPANARVARLAVRVAVLAVVLAVLVSFESVRVSLPMAVLQIIAVATMWTPFALMVLFLVMQRLPNGQDPAPFGRHVGDAWFVTLIVCTFVIAFWDSLRMMTSFPIAFGARSGVVLELVFLSLIIFRLFQIRGKTPPRHA